MAQTLCISTAKLTIFQKVITNLSVSVKLVSFEFWEIIFADIVRSLKMFCYAGFTYIIM